MNNKADFLASLAQALSALPTEERQAAVKYYEEYFEEAGPGREQEILDEMGNPVAVAQSILKDYSSVSVQPEPVVEAPRADEIPKAPWEQPAPDARKVVEDVWKSVTEAAGAAAAAARQAGQEAAAAATRAAHDAAGTATSAAREATAERQVQHFWLRWGLPTWAFVLILVLGTPIIISILGGLLGLVGAIIGLVAGAVGIAVGLVVAVFTVFFGIAIAGVAMVIGGIAAVVVGIFTFLLHPATSVLAIGIGALLASVGIVVTALGWWVAIKIVPKGIKAVVLFCTKMTARLRAGFSKRGYRQ